MPQRTTILSEALFGLSERTRPIAHARLVWLLEGLDSYQRSAIDLFERYVETGQWNFYEFAHCLGQDPETAYRILKEAYRQILSDLKINEDIPSPDTLH